MKTIAIIPARMMASRYPGKPMKRILGIPMVGHVYLRTTLQNSFDAICVATCDEEIYDYIRSIGGLAVMTKDTHENCIDRTIEALQIIEHTSKTRFDIVGMVQGDEPLVNPVVFESPLAILKENNHIPVVNVAVIISSEEELDSPGAVKVVTDPSGQAIYFSREPIPSRKKGGSHGWLKQTGLIFFRRDYLLKFNDLPKGPLEKFESVDMLRFVENRLPVQTYTTDLSCVSVDFPEDLRLAEKAMAKDSLFQQYRERSP